MNVKNQQFFETFFQSLTEKTYAMKTVQIYNS